MFYVAYRTLLVMFCVLKFYFVDFYGMFTSSPRPDYLQVPTYYRLIVLGLTSFKSTPLVQYVEMNQKIDTISSLDAGVLLAVVMSI